ncbi:hypothetical protein, partial [Nocardia abscessus]
MSEAVKGELALRGRRWFPGLYRAVGAEWVADGFDAGEVFGQRLGVVGDLDFRGAAAGAGGDLMGAFGIEHQNRRLADSAKGG